jgi:flagellin-like hook-associated protein FlgL
MPPRPMDAAVPRTVDGLLERIRTLVAQTNHGSASGATLHAHRREIERLKSQLAECVKRNLNGETTWGSSAGQDRE